MNSISGPSQPHVLNNNFKSELTQEQIPAFLQSLKEKKQNQLLKLIDQIAELQQQKSVTLRTIQCAQVVLQMHQINPFDITNEFLIESIDALRTYLNADQVRAVIADCPFANTVLRYNQLHDMDYSSEKKFKLACFIEDKTHRKVKNAARTRYYKKSAHSLPCAVQIEPKGKSIYILIKDKHIIKASGDSIKYRGALQVPYDASHPIMNVVRGVNEIHKHDVCPYLYSKQEDYLKGVIEAIEFKHSFIKQDMQVHKNFTGSKGIWPLLSVANFSKEMEIQKILRTSFLTPLGQNLWNIAKKPLSVIIAVADQIGSGIQKLHQSCCFYGNLNYKNCLYHINPDQTISAGLIDFRKAFGLNYQELPFPLNEGYYWTLSSTPPELFGNKNFVGDLLKVEVWALGCLYYFMLKGKNPPWEKLLIENGNKTESTPYHLDIRQMEQMVTEEIEMKRTELLKIESRSAEKEFTLLIYDMMRLDPALRPDMDTIISQIQKIKNRI